LRPEMIGESEGGHASRCEVTILIPAYRESEYITATILGIVEAFVSAHMQFEILVVLDTVPNDQTGARLAEAATKASQIRVIERQGRRGVGDAIRTGITHALGKVVIVVMGDQSEEAEDVVKLAEIARFNDIVFTNRFRGGRPEGYPRVKYLANRLCNLSAKLLFHVPYSDITNAFKAYRRAIIADLNLTATGFEVFLELPLKGMRRAHRTVEVEVRHRVMKRKVAKLSVTKDGYGYVVLLISLLRNSYRS